MLSRGELTGFSIELANIIREIYRLNSAGGSLHIVLDDGNVEDNDIVWCLRNSIAELEGHEKALYERCARMLLILSEKERLRFINCCFGYARKWHVEKEEE